MSTSCQAASPISNARSLPARPRMRIPSDKEQFPFVFADSRTSKSAGLHRNMPVSKASYVVSSLPISTIRSPLRLTLVASSKSKTSSILRINGENHFAGYQRLFEESPCCSGFKDVVSHEQHEGVVEFVSGFQNGDAIGLVVMNVFHQSY